MKKQMFLPIYLIFCTLIACNVVQNEKIRSYIVSYSSLDSIELDSARQKNGIFITKGRTASKETVDWRSKGDYKTKYDELCRKHGDMNYFKKISYIVYPMLGLYFMDDVVSIDVVSNKDFDAAHPAGASLADVARFCSATPAPFIRNGYRNSYNWDNLTPGWKKSTYLSDRVNYARSTNSYSQTIFDYTENYPVDTVLSTLKSSDLELIGLGNGFEIGLLTFESKPEKTPAIHTITVRLTTNTGKILKSSINYNFE